MSEEPQKKRRSKRTSNGPIPNTVVAGTKPDLSKWHIALNDNMGQAFRPVAPELWRSTMLELRARFQRARDSDGALLCRLFQSCTADRKQVDAMQSQTPDGHFVFAQGGMYTDFRVYRDEQRRPIITDVPTLDLDGKPIVDSSGRAILCELPSGRSVFVIGTPCKGFDIAPLSDFAGSCIWSAQPDVISWIPPETLRASTDRERWLWTLFELAWSGLHPALKAERLTWYSSKNDLGEPAPISIPYDRAQIEAVRAIFPMGRFIPESWTKRLPTYFRSELPDFFTASVFTIDFFLSGSSPADPNHSPDAAGNRGRKRRERRDSGKRLKADARRAAVLSYLDQHGNWDGDREELSKELAKKGIKVSVTTLWRDLKGTRHAQFGRPRRAARGKRETEPISDEPIPGEKHFDAWITPDDDDSIS